MATRESDFLIVMEGGYLWFVVVVVVFCCCCCFSVAGRSSLSVVEDIAGAMGVVAVEGAARVSWGSPADQ